MLFLISVLVAFGLIAAFFASCRSLFVMAEPEPAPMSAEESQFMQEYDTAVAEQVKALMSYTPVPL